MSNQLTTQDHTPAIVQAGQAANKLARKNAFAEYRSRKAPNTIKAQDSDLQLFTDFLTAHNAPPIGAMNTTPEAWTGITFGLVQAFRNYLIQEAYAVTTVNRALSTVKKYAAIAMQAGILDTTENALIRTVTGYSRKEAKRINSNREETRRPLETGATGKKAEHTSITPTQARKLKQGHDHASPQGRRDTVLMCLLLDLGLRCGEVAGLTVGNVNLADGTIKFYRPKVDKEQTHEMKRDLLKAMKAYFEYDAPPMNDAPLLRASKKGGELTSAGMSERAITKRVKSLGKKLCNLDKLSAHDCRHFWATNAARNGTDPFALQEAGGWNSLAMPRRYVEAAKIANENVHLDV